MMALYFPALVKKVWVSFSEGVRFHFSLYCKARTNKTRIRIRHHFLYKPISTHELDFTRQIPEFVIDRSRKSSEIAQKTYRFRSYILSSKLYRGAIRYQATPSALPAYFCSGEYGTSLCSLLSPWLTSTCIVGSSDFGIRCCFTNRVIK